MALQAPGSEGVLFCRGRRLCARYCSQAGQRAQLPAGGPASGQRQLGPRGRALIQQRQQATGSSQTFPAAAGIVLNRQGLT